jgi:hypothetical protein
MASKIREAKIINNKPPNTAQAPLNLTNSAKELDNQHMNPTSYNLHPSF